MKYAEYYTKQNVITLNAQVLVLVKPAIYELMTAPRCLLNRTKAFVKIKKKKKKKKNFHIYKILFYWILNDRYKRFTSSKLNETHKDIFLSKKWDENANANVNVNGEQWNLQKEKILIEKVTNIDHKSKKILRKRFEGEKEGNSQISDQYISTNVINAVTNITFDATTFFENSFVSTEKTLLYENNREEELRKISEHIKKESISMNYLLENASLHLKEFSFFENFHFCKYICVPSSLYLTKVHIKSFHLMLKNEKQLTVSLLLDIVVNKKDNVFFNETENNELDKMLSAVKNVILCKTCNSSIITYSKNAMVMPDITLNVNSFFANAFCEECTCFSYGNLKDYTNNNIIINPNSVAFNYDLISQMNLVIKKEAIRSLRNVLFCHICYNSVGYFERDENEYNNKYEIGGQHRYNEQIGGTNKPYTMYYYEKKKNNDMIKNMLFNINDEQDKKEYINLEKVMINFTNQEKKEKIEEQKINNKIDSPNEKNEKEKKNRCERNNSTFTKKEDDYVSSCNDVQYSSHELERKKKLMKRSFQLYLLKHKIQLILNDENIFKNYSDVLFLNEYMFNICNKYNTHLFYIKCEEKRYILEIKIFIKNMYICIIEKDKQSAEKNNPFFQKVLKVIYCQKEEKYLIKNINYELINVSKKIYEEALKMLVTYSFASDIFTNKLFSYMHLVQ